MAAKMGRRSEGEIARCRALSQSAREAALRELGPTEPDDTDESTGVHEVKTLLNRHKLERAAQDSIPDK